MEMYSQNKITDRQPVAAGRFYPADKATLSRDLTALFGECKKPDRKRNVQAIISPHAGYVFSGKTAASAFSAIPVNASYENIFIIGSSHIMSFDGASVYNTGDYITPLGRMMVNKEIAEKLIKKNKVFNYPATSHLQEHSIEVQLPFIQYYFKKTPMIIPIIIGANNDITIKLIAEAVRPWFSSANLFIISSDFSHYPPYAEAIELDKQTALGIKSGKPAFFLNTLEKNSQRRGGPVSTGMRKSRQWVSIQAAGTGSCCKEPRGMSGKNLSARRAGIPTGASRGQRRA
jgi:AmmeMemoRadiSam system protein B